MSIRSQSLYELNCPDAEHKGVLGNVFVSEERKYLRN
jgi:hypothetical protein